MSDSRERLVSVLQALASALAGIDTSNMEAVAAEVRGMMASLKREAAAYTAFVSRLRGARTASGRVPLPMKTVNIGSPTAPKAPKALPGARGLVARLPAPPASPKSPGYSRPASRPVLAPSPPTAPRKGVAPRPTPPRQPASPASPVTASPASPVTASPASPVTASPVTASSQSSPQIDEIRALYDLVLSILKQKKGTCSRSMKRRQIAGRPGGKPTNMATKLSATLGKACAKLARFCEVLECEVMSMMFKLLFPFADDETHPCGHEYRDEEYHGSL